MAVAAGEQAAPPEPDFLAPIAEEREWQVHEAQDGRWRLYCNVDSKVGEDAASLLREFFKRLDVLFGEDAFLDTPEVETSKLEGDRIILLFTNEQEDVYAMADAMAENWPHLAEWAEVAREFPRMQHWNPMAAAVLHDDTTQEVPNPEMQVAHVAVQFEILRRYGRVPRWIGEAISYAIQFEMAKGIYGYFRTGSEAISEDYNTSWDYGCKEALSRNPATMARLMSSSGLQFNQEGAYLQFGLAQWWLAKKPAGVPAMLREFRERRPDHYQREHDWEPEAKAQEEVLAAAFGSDMFSQMADYWATSNIVGGPDARKAAVLAAVQDFVEKFELKQFTDSQKRITVYTESGASMGRKCAKSAGRALSRIDDALGKPKRGDETEPLTAFFVRDREVYRALCDAIGESDSKLSRAMEAFRTGVGFTIYEPLVTCYFDDVATQEESAPDQSVAHNTVHLELTRRFGVLPLWLAEGTACVVEDEEFKAVWGQWNTGGFVFTASRSNWRHKAEHVVTNDEDWVRVYDWEDITFGETPPEVKKPKPTLMDLYAYTARPFRDDLGHMAFAFAAYGLEADPEGYKRLLEALQEEYSQKWTSGGVFQPEPDAMSEMVLAAFGEDFPQKFVRWWETDGDKRPK